MNSPTLILVVALTLKALLGFHRALSGAMGEAYNLLLHRLSDTVIISRPDLVSRPDPLDRRPRFARRVARIFKLAQGSPSFLLR